MLIYILFCSIFKEVPLSFLLREVGPETCRGPGAEGSQGGWRCFPVLHPELQARAWGKRWAAPEPWSPALGSSASDCLAEELRLSVGSGERAEGI